MSDIENIVKMAFCTEEVARAALAKTGNVIEAVCMILDFKPILAPKQKVMDEEQQKFKRMRLDMERMDNNIQDGLKKKDQPESSCLDLQDTRNLPLQSVQHYDHTPQNRPVAPVTKE